MAGHPPGKTIVMPALVAGISLMQAQREKNGMTGTSPAMAAALAQSAEPLPAIAHGAWISITFAVGSRATASAAFFIACWVATAASLTASLAASADFLLKSSSLDCCSLSLVLKSAVESCHQ